VQENAAAVALRHRILAQQAHAALVALRCACAAAFSVASAAAWVARSVRAAAAFGRDHAARQAARNNLRVQSADRDWDWSSHAHRVDSATAAVHHAVLPIAMPLYERNRSPLVGRVHDATFEILHSNGITGLINYTRRREHRRMQNVRGCRNCAARQRSPET
jgi:hypothetical protein